MKITVIFRRLYLIVFLLVLYPTSVSAQIQNLYDLQRRIDLFIDDTHKVESFSNLILADTSSLYIGRLPHISLGWGMAVALNDSFFNDASNNDLKSLSLPTFSPAFGFNVRVGGLEEHITRLPFDLGFRFSLFDINHNILSPLIDPLLGNFDLYFISYNIGTDFRVPIFEEQRLVPGLTLGIGYAFQSSQFKFPLKIGQEIIASGLSIGDNKLKLSNSMYRKETYIHTIGIKIQTSKNLAVVEPYVGLEPFLFLGKTVFNLDSDIEIDDGSGFTSYNDYLNKGKKYIENTIFTIKEGTIEYSKFSVGGGIRFFTGASLHFGGWYLLDINYSVDLVSQIWGLSLSSRYEF